MEKLIKHLEEAIKIAKSLKGISTTVDPKLSTAKQVRNIISTKLKSKYPGGISGYNDKRKDGTRRMKFDHLTFGKATANTIKERIEALDEVVNCDIEVCHGRLGNKWNRVIVIYKPKDLEL